MGGLVWGTPFQVSAFGPSQSKFPDFRHCCLEPYRMLTCGSLKYRDCKVPHFSIPGLILFLELRSVCSPGAGLSLFTKAVLCAGETPPFHFTPGEQRDNSWVGGHDREDQGASPTGGRAPQTPEE